MLLVPCHSRRRSVYVFCGKRCSRDRERWCSSTRRFIPCRALLCSAPVSSLVLQADLFAPRKVIRFPRDRLVRNRSSTVKCTNNNIPCPGPPRAKTSKGAQQPPYNRTRRGSRSFHPLDTRQGDVSRAERPSSISPNAEVGVGDNHKRLWLFCTYMDQTGGLVLGTDANLPPPKKKNNIAARARHHTALHTALALTLLPAHHTP